MTRKKESTQEFRGIQDLNVIDLILIDHRFLKECIEVLTCDDGTTKKRRTMAMAKNFLTAIAAHSSMEKEAIYTPLKNNSELHFNILEAEVEHGIVDEKVKTLQAKLYKARSLKDEVKAELKVLADLVKHHIMEEESEILPKMQQEIDDQTLTDLGKSFMQLRKFTAKDLKDYPQLQDELIQWKDSIQKVSSEFLTKMDKFVENIQH